MPLFLLKTEIIILKISNNKEHWKQEFFCSGVKVRDEKCSNNKNIFVGGDKKREEE